MFNFCDFFRKSRDAECTAPEDSIFHRKYGSLKPLLLANNRALEIIADLENTICQDKPFTYMHAVSQTESLVMDLGDGLRPGRRGAHAELDDVSSIPFRALLQGMKHEPVDWYVEQFMRGNDRFTAEAESA